MDFIKNSRESDHVSTKLLRMLEYLGFSVIQARSRLECSFVGTHHTIHHLFGYSPWILAIKHDVEYFFEYVRDHGDVIELQNLLQSQGDNNTRESWKKSLVLVTEYGNGEKVRQSARDLNFPFDNIWEI